MIKTRILKKIMYPNILKEKINCTLKIDSGKDYNSLW